MSKTIVDKLNLHKYQKTVVLYTPEWEEGLASLENADHELKDGQPYDLIFAFVENMESLQRLMREVIDHSYLQESGYLYVAYPKKGNKVYPTYIHRVELFPGLGADSEGYIGTSRIKFNRMVGMNEVFTVVGFKNEGNKKAPAAAKPSQCVDDYISFIPNIEDDLRDHPAELAFYQSLTPGYRKDWARYVYSAVQEGTRAKRREEMKAVLAKGYKSMDIYRRDN